MVSPDDDEDVRAVSRIDAVPSILEVVRNATGLRLAFVARVTDDGWKALAVQDAMGFGIVPGQHLDVTAPLDCDTGDAQRAVVVDQASADPELDAHPMPKLYGLESYIAVPIFLPDGSHYGNLCALDSRPIELKSSQALPTMQIFAALIGRMLGDELRHARMERDLHDEKDAAVLREQFIAVLGHDLRAPMSAILTGAELLQARTAGLEQQVAARIRSSVTRMSSLVSDVLDFARGRLGGGIPTTKQHIADVALLVAQAVDEVRASHPGREIRLTGAGGALLGDATRLAQVMSNLLENAVAHGDPAGPIEVTLDGDESELRVRVANRGAPIPAEVLPRLFLPYQRQGAASGGLGLGLYIVSEIVRSHGGHVDVRNDGDRIVFECTIPRGVAPLAAAA